ncbi:MAG: AraC family transcriptional regulator [Rhizobium sp.]
MTFQPRMDNKIEGFSVVGGVQRRVWNGIVADVWDVNCAAYAGGYYVSSDPRLFILLDTRGRGQCNVRLSPRAAAMRQGEEQPISYIPAGMEMWADLVDIDFVRHLDIHFSADALSRRLMEDLDPARLANPRLLFSDPRVLALADLIAAECENPEPLHDLYGDGLAVSLLIDVLQLRRAVPRKRSKLAAWQLRRAVDYIEAHCLRSIRLEELAALTNLSQSHFSHAFKASTGIPPHQWQTKARLDRAKQLLAGGTPLTDVAVETGFSDQAHFTRVFRKNTGTTPASWKKSQFV